MNVLCLKLSYVVGDKYNRVYPSGKLKYQAGKISGRSSIPPLPVK